MAQEKPPIGQTVTLTNGQLAEVYRHSYAIEGLDEDELHVMTLTEDGQYDECLTASLDDIEVVE